MGIVLSAEFWVTDKAHPQGEYAGPSKHSSFPGISSSSDKWERWSCAAEAWLRGKKQDDGIDKTLWRVHDELYDLTSFVHRHPGGSDWLSMTQGMDITELFENSHVINVEKVEATLKKFYIKEASHPRNSPYTFEPNGFYKTLKKRVEPVLKEKGTGPTVAIRLMQDLMAAGFVLLCVLGVVLDSYWPIVAGGLSLGMSTVSAHNFLHLRDNWRKYYLDLSLCSHYEWKIEHVFSHHGFSNTAWDVDMLRMIPFGDFFVNRKKLWIQRYGVWLYGNFIFPSFFFATFICRMVYIVAGKQKLQMENLLPVLQLGLFLAYSQSGIMTGVAFWILLHMVCNLWLGITAIIAAHHHPLCFHDGDEPRAKPDYGLCVLDATCVKVEDNNRNLFQIMTTFGEHNLHHLFPTVCTSKLGYIKSILEKTMKEFEEEFIFLTQWQMFTGVYKQLARIKPHSFQYKLQERRKTQVQAVWSTKM